MGAKAGDVWIAGGSGEPIGHRGRTSGRDAAHFAAPKGAASPASGGV